MLNKLMFIILVILGLNTSAGLNSTHWKVITRDIARDGDSKDRQEFEAARQAFLHIKDEEDAKVAALYIEQKWKRTFGLDATVGSTGQKGSLMNLIRYPLMTKEQAKIATRQILKNNTIARLLDQEGLQVITS